MERILLFLLGIDQILLCFVQIVVRCGAYQRHHLPIFRGTYHHIDDVLPDRLFVLRRDQAGRRFVLRR